MTALYLSRLGQNSRPTAILSGVLKEIHFLHLFSTLHQNEQKTVATRLMGIKFFVTTELHLCSDEKFTESK